MDSHELQALLESVRAGRLEPEAAARELQARASFAEVGDFAKIDLHRRQRCGFPEVVFGQGKTPDQIASILKRLAEHGEGALATRVSAEAAELLVREFPQGQHNVLGRTFRIPPREDIRPKLGRVAIVTAGTSDLPVAEEARVTAEAWSCEVELIADVGVAGIHRLFGRLDRLRAADAIVCVAGMEGALPSVVGGLVDCPVIAVPTSIGYGANLHGLAPLLTMLNSCASTVVVVNIDSGFNGGHVAGLIARRAGQARGNGAPIGQGASHDA
jgi:NCAIR mutase (PurE)-related protein